MRCLLLLGLVAVAVSSVAAVPLVAQEPGADRTWQLEGLRSGFCVQLLLDPASKALENLPEGFRPLPASQLTDLHRALRSDVEGQPELASWSPSRLCLHAIDTVRTADFTLADRSGKRPYLFGMWTVAAADPSGTARDVVLQLFVSSGRLIRSARLAGHVAQEARLMMGKVPFVDVEGTPSTEDRFQVKMGKTTVTWDGHLAGDSAQVQAPIEIAWASRGEKGEARTGRLILRPAYSQAMVGSLKVDGKDAFAKALKASPTRFAGPAYRGGGGVVSFAR
jgi:hypothetical protein